MDAYGQRMQGLDAQAAAALAAAAAAPSLPAAAAGAAKAAGAGHGGMPPTDSARSLDGEGEAASDYASADSRRRSLEEEAALNAEFERHVVVI